MRRAMELGIPKSEVRQALLAYAATLKPSGEEKDRYEVMLVKHKGLERGVLNRDDLPDVDISWIESFRDGVEY